MSFYEIPTQFLNILCSPLFSFVFLLLLSSFLEGDNKYVLSCVIQHEAGGLSKMLDIVGPLIILL